MKAQEMINADTFRPSNDYWAETHRVENQPEALENYNVFESDLALKEAVLAHDASWATQDLEKFGALCGSKDVIDLGYPMKINPYCIPMIVMENVAMKFAIILLTISLCLYPWKQGYMLHTGKAKRGLMSLVRQKA